MPWLSRIAIVFSLSWCGLSPALAGVIYVDNLRGDDVADGTNPTSVDFRNGPVRTIRRGLQLMHKGGTLNIANHGTPYYESMELVGGRFSGSPFRQTLIEGNGAELNGSFRVPLQAWRKEADHLWKFTPLRKGHYLLLFEDHPLPETPIPPNSRTLPEIPTGNWAAWKGSIYYRTRKFEVPTDLDLWFAVRSVGVTIYDTHDIIVQNLKVRHFRIDGLNAHDRCENIILDTITAEENGRAGVVSAGTSFVEIFRPTIQNNRLHSVLITEKAAVQIDDETAVKPAPTIAD